MEVSPVLGFEEFLENRHTGPAIARNLAGLLKSVDMDMNDSITLPTLDGAANNKRAFKVFKKRVKVCSPHDLQRSVEHGLGRAGKRKNASLEAHIALNSKQSRSLHTSVLSSQRLLKSQLSRGVSKRRCKRVFRLHRIRWGGLYRMLRQSRKLETDIKVALTDSTTGQCAERAAFVAPVVTTTQTMASASASPQSAKETESSEEEEEDAGDENAEDSDVDQHRCLPASAWKKNNELESVLTVPYEVSQALQGHTGVGLDKGGAEETWEDVHAKGLEADIIQFREVTAEEVERRLLKLDNDTLLSLRMNPGLDTQDKSATVELMEAEYNRQLRHRGTHLLKKNTPDDQVGGARVVDGAHNTTKDGAAGASAPQASKRRRTLGELTAACSAPRSMMQEAPESEESVMETVLAEKIR
ncbi:hypothetical protein CYMTET_25187, partial [Cymbomonas tetramitiformis]